MFSCGYCKNFKNTYFEEHLRTTAFLFNYALADIYYADEFGLFFKFYHPYLYVWKVKSLLEGSLLNSG